MISAALALLPARASAATCSTVKIAAPSGAANDITFTFDKAYTCGTYANGDPWVVVDATTKAVRRRQRRSGGDD